MAFAVTQRIMELRPTDVGCANCQKAYEDWSALRTCLLPVWDENVFIGRLAAVGGNHVSVLDVSAGVSEVSAWRFEHFAERLTFGRRFWGKNKRFSEWVTWADASTVSEVAFACVASGMPQAAVCEAAAPGRAAARITLLMLPFRASEAAPGLDVSKVLVALADAASWAHAESAPPRRPSNVLMGPWAGDKALAGS